MRAPYKIVSRTIDGKRVTLDGYKCHSAKSMAGRIFQSPTIKSIKVSDKRKNVYLRLSKNRRGRVLQYLTINVSSSKALFG
jgi:hypothetical protein